MSKNPRSILIEYCHDEHICPWKGGYCSKSCSWLDCYGNVQVCSEHGHPSGLITRRKRVF
jgi:hypothetical protein